MYMAINCTLVTLIPKTTAAKSIKDYRPIVSCNIIYKIISKVMNNRLGKVPGKIIHHSQAAFVLGKHIHYHILLAYELIRGYTRKAETPWCLIQMDIQKVYDTVYWKALENILREVGFHPKFIRWTMLDVTTISYRYNINEDYTEILKAKRGLRQYDPLSLLLFVIVMEYLNKTL